MGHHYLAHPVRGQRDLGPRDRDRLEGYGAPAAARASPLGGGGAQPSAGRTLAGRNADRRRHPGNGPPGRPLPRIRRPRHAGGHRRGGFIGMLHALTLRDQLRAVGLDDPVTFADAFHTATAETVEPWYRTTLATDRYRLGEIEAGIRGETYDPQDPQYQLEMALDAASRHDPDCLRASLDIRFVLRTPEEVFARTELRDKTVELGSGWREEQPLGPDREQLLALASTQGTSINLDPRDGLFQ